MNRNVGIAEGTQTFALAAVFVGERFYDHAPLSMETSRSGAFVYRESDKLLWEGQVFWA